jgi:hypothetical protein
VELTNEQWTWLIVAVVALVVIAVVVVLLRNKSQHRQSDELRGRFGPEYDRTVEDSRSRREAEENLRHREERADSLQIRDLSGAQREHYGNWWNQVQSMFVERPAIALAEADRLVTDLMRDRGYPATDTNSALEDLSVRHAGLVERLRRAKGAQHEAAGVDAMRDAMLDYRAVVAELLSVDLRSMQDREPR